MSVFILKSFSDTANALSVFSIYKDSGSVKGNEVVHIEGLFGVKIVKIASGQSHTLAIDSDGNLYSWGFDSSGQVGDGDLTQNHRSNNVLSPVKLTGLDTGEVYVNALIDAFIVDIAAGTDFSAALDDEGNIYTWGRDSNGLIGDGALMQNHSGSNVLAPLKISGLDTGSTYVNALKDAKITKISSNGICILALDDSGNIYSWGYDYNGQIGDGTLTQNHSGTNVMSPVKLTGLNTGATYVNALKDARIVDISCGSSVSMALDDESNLYIWGRDDFGQIGDGELTGNHLGNSIDGDVPAAIRLSGLDTGSTYSNQLQDATIVQIEAGGFTPMAVDVMGNLYIWGQDSRGMVGDGDLTQNHKDDHVISPIKLTGLYTGTEYVNYLKDVKIKKISANVNHQMALDEDGNLYTWGYDYNGQIGDGDLENNHRDYMSPSDVPAPLKISGLDSGDVYVNALKDVKIESIYAGGRASAAIDVHGGIYTWGYDFNGQAGDGELTENRQKNYDIVAPIYLTKADTGSVYLNPFYLDDSEYTVYLDRSACFDLTLPFPTIIRCTTPPHEKGVVDVTVVDSLGERSVLSKAYTYIDYSTPGVPNTGGN